jgi:hypothetical protein
MDARKRQLAAKPEEERVPIALRTLLEKTSFLKENCNDI